MNCNTGVLTYNNKLFFFNSGLSANFTLVDERWHKLLISTHGCILTAAMDGQATLESKVTNICHQKQYLREVLIDASEFCLMKESPGSGW